VLTAVFGTRAFFCVEFLRTASVYVAIGMSWWCRILQCRISNRKNQQSWESMRFLGRCES
jgi:hypothetical protein